MRRGLGAAIAVLLCSVAAVHALRDRTTFGWYPAHDLYAYFYPKALYALGALRDGGRGLLWNPYQNCGQPFLALPQTGLWYPVYLLFLVFRPETALRAVLATHLVTGGLGTYALGRALGARPTAALVGALAFELGNAMMALTISAPMHAAPFAWLPLALWACERLLRAPSLPRALTLAIVLTMAILPGMPQTVFMIYQLIGLRVVWELVTRPGSRQTLPLCFVALALPVALAAVELLPELEVTAQSLRSAALGAREVSPHDQWNLGQLRSQLALRSSLQPFVLVPTVVGAVAFMARGTRRAAVFYAGAGVLFTVLALGPGSPIYGLYRHLPLTEVFRQPVRFLWMTSFCLAVLAALGTEALATLGSAGGRVLPLAAVGAAAAILALFRLATPNGLVPLEWAAAGLVVVAAAGGLVGRNTSGWAPLVVAVALVLQLTLAPASNALYLLPSEPQYFAAQQSADTIRLTWGPADRVHLVHRHPDVLQYRMMPKTASLLRLPAVSDYEPLATRRYAELYTMMLSGRPLTDLNQFLYGPAPSPRALNRRLLDLTGVRYLLVDNALVPDIEAATPPFQPLASGEEFSVYENPQRLPRAFYAPRVEVVPESEALLRRLATGGDDLRQIALVEAVPASGFRGDAAPASGTVRFVRNDPEHLTLEVDAGARGFLVLTDQYFSGWSATIDGRPVGIERANYAFRLVEVPAGKSTVEFVYSPRSLWLGASISVASVVGVLALLSWRWRPRADRRWTRD